jgi:hypothetical protein
MEMKYFRGATNHKKGFSFWWSTQIYPRIKEGWRKKKRPS